MTTMTYKVQGMTCEHCVRAVTSELTALDGVTEVVINLHANALSDVTVTSAQALENAAVQAAVDEAGYELVS
jgi:copper chaperone CopZ